MSKTYLTRKEIGQLELCLTEEEWDKICDQIKKDHSGKYPQDWADKVISSGLAARVFKRWQNPSI